MLFCLEIPPTKTIFTIADYERTTVYICIRKNRRLIFSINFYVIIIYINFYMIIISINFYMIIIYINFYIDNFLYDF